MGCWGRGYDFGCRGDLVAFTARFGAVLRHPLSPLVRSAIPFSEPVIAIIFGVFAPSRGWFRGRLHSRGLALVAGLGAVFCHVSDPLPARAVSLILPVPAVGLLVLTSSSSGATSSTWAAVHLKLLVDAPGLVLVFAPAN